MKWVNEKTGKSVENPMNEVGSSIPDPNELVDSKTGKESSSMSDELIQRKAYEKRHKEYR